MIIKRINQYIWFLVKYIITHLTINLNDLESLPLLNDFS